MMTRYCVLYPDAENVHLIKDVGMIAYKMFKLFNYEAYIACYENGNYDYLDKDVKGLKLSFIERRYNNKIFDGIRHLRKNAKNIDILQLFHVTLSSVVYAFAYKMFNKRGKIYLKLDCTERLVDVIKGLSDIKFKFFNMFINKVDIIGIEQERLYEELKKILPMHVGKLILTPNGIDYQSSAKYKDIEYLDKENTILYVGRVGSPEKATDIFLDAIAKIKDIDNSGWKVSVVGPVYEGFQEYIDAFLRENKKVKDIMQFKGPIYEREQLYEEYRRAKIFCLSSNYESFGIALIEAASFGDVIISTDVGIARELTDYSNGSVVSIGDSDSLAEKLKEFMAKDSLEHMSRVTEKLCRDKFDWNKIVSMLHEKIMDISRG